MTAPSNNDWTSPVVLTGSSGTVTVVTNGADPLPPTMHPDGYGTSSVLYTASGALEHTVWYTWHAPAGTCEVDTLSTDPSLFWDSYLEVFEMPSGGTGVGDLSLLAHNDDFGGTTLSKATWVTDGTTTYYIRVSDWPDGPGGNDGVTAGSLHYSLVSAPVVVVQDVGPCDRLGCNEETVAVITYPCGLNVLCDIEDQIALNYSRIRNDFSTAEVTVNLAGDGVDCCDCMGKVRAWCHELHIYRGSEEVWSGPITYVSYGRDDVFISARDLMAWFDRAPITVELDVDEMDLVDIAVKVIQDNVISEQAGCYIIEKTASGVIPENGYYKDIGEGYVGDVLRELVGLGMNFTVLGRKLILWGAAPLATIGTITEQDFSGDVRVVEDGALAVTSAIVLGNGSEGFASVAGACGNVGLIVSRDTLDSDEDAEALAKQYVASGYPTPLQVQMPGEATLSPEAPLCLSELVPGVNLGVSIEWSCRPAFSNMTLTSMKVVVDADTESIGINLETPESIPEVVDA